MFHIVQSTSLYDRYVIKKTFLENLGYKCNLWHPKTFNEKINWYKLNDKNPLYPSLIDKISVKPIVASVIGEQYIIKSISEGYTNATQIPWDDLPDQFVVKCNHDSGSTIVCTDKSRFDVEFATKQLNKALSIKSSQTYTRARICEKIAPKILIEEYLMGGDLKDYKFFCFNGKAKIFKIDRGRQLGKHRANYYLVDGTFIDCSEECCPNLKESIDVFPSNFGEMVDIANKLATFVKREFIRVDLYNVNRKIYFGELTFYPAGGYGKFELEKWDRIFGDMIHLQ